MMKVSVDSSQILKAIKGSTKVMDTSAVNKVIAVKMRNHLWDHFKKEEGSGGKWKPLSPVTLKLRKQGGGGAKILQDTGQYRNSLVVRYTKKDAEVSTNVFYAKYHEYRSWSQKTTQKQTWWFLSKGIPMGVGTTLTVPKRDVFWLSKPFIGQIVNSYLGRLLKAWQ
jgi:phage gpG-like protein